MQSPEFDPGSDSNTVEPDRYFRFRTPGGAVFRRPDIGQQFSIISMVESVLASIGRQQSVRPTVTLTCKHCIAMVEISATVNAILSVRDVINADVRTLHEVLSPESDFT